MNGVYRINLRHLRIFETIARLGSIRKAADAVHLSQPAVTQAMVRLECQIGSGLFERRSSGTFLTRAGRVLLERVQTMFRDMEEAIDTFGAATAKGRRLSLIAERLTRSQIRSLAAISHGRSFADASRRIGISQPSLHRAARELERNLGKPLFRQSMHGLTTTHAGTELSRKLSLAFREIEWGIEESRAISGIHIGEIRIGVMALAGSYLLAHPLVDLTQRYPRVRAHVTTGSGDYLAACLHSGEVDFVIGLVSTSLDPALFDREPLVSSGYFVVSRRDHPLVRRASVTKADLCRYEWIIPITGATRREAFDKLFESMPVRPKANIETYSLATIRLLLSRSDRLTLLTRFEFEYEEGTGVLSKLSYPWVEPIHSLGVTTRARWQPTTMHREFLALIRHRAAEMGSPTVGSETRAKRDDSRIVKAKKPLSGTRLLPRAPRDV